MIEPRIPAPGDVVGGRYRVDRVLGQGGMGTVLAATHQVTGKIVALKWLMPSLAGSPHAAARFLREARAGARVRHPNVVDVHDVGQDRDALYLVMELLEGEPLGKFLKRGRVPYQDLIRLLLPAMRGVAAAHRMRVIHRDLKPDNIFLCSDPDGGPPQPRVLDFGISKLTDEGVPQDLTRTGQVIGTPCYMSPEQIHGIKDVDERCDVYALGVILYEGLSGTLPFKAETYPALLHEIAYGDSVPVRTLRPELPADLERIITKAMARSPADRYPNVEAFIADLQALLGASSATDGSERRRALRALGLGAAAAAAALIAAGAWFWWKDQATSHAAPPVPTGEARPATEARPSEPPSSDPVQDSVPAPTPERSGTIRVDDFVP